MATIRFSVHRNPLTDKEGNNTYQVRHEPTGTVKTKEFTEHLQLHNTIRPAVMEMALAVLKDEIVEMLLDNKRVHIDGLGTFFLKLGFRKEQDEEGNEQKTAFTNPADITGNNVRIDSIGFSPDKAFVEQTNRKAVHFENLTGRGSVGHSARYTNEQLVSKIDDYLTSNDYLTRRTLTHEFGLTSYMALKWLDRLTTGPSPMLKAEKTGNTIIYRRR